MSQTKETPTRAATLAGAQIISLPGGDDLNTTISSVEKAKVVATFTDLRGRNARRVEATHQEVMRALREEAQVNYASKDACPLVQMAELGDQRTGKRSLRNANNVLRMYGVVGDYDDGKVSLPEAVEMARKAGLKAYFYTTASHTPQAPRWRVIAPFAAPIRVEDYLTRAELLNGIFAGILASESAEYSRGFFIGKVSCVEFMDELLDDGQFIEDLDLVIAPAPFTARSGGRSKAKTGKDADDLDRIIALQTVNRKTMEKVRAATLALPEQFWGGTRGAWVKLCMALKSLAETEFGEEANELWHEVSSKDKRYDFDETQRIWDTTNPEKITFRSIFRWMKDSGISLASLAQDKAAEFEGHREAERLPANISFEVGDKPNFARDKHGKIQPSLNNLLAALRRPDVCGFAIAYDAFKGELMCAAEPGQWQPFRDVYYVDMRSTLETGDLGFKTIRSESIRDAVSKVAEEKTFDSAQLWLNSLSWDRAGRADSFLAVYFGVEDTTYTRAVSRYIWTALAGRVLVPGVKADMVPILVGPQGAGKSSGVMAMVPQAECYAEISFGEKDDDKARKLKGVLIAELAELSGLHRRELEAIKAFVTRQAEKWIQKFKEHATTYARRSLFIGTTNADEFLADETGNRRWLPVKVTKVDRDAIARDRNQLWAEAREMFLEGGVAYQEAEALAGDVHAEFTISDAWVDAIAAWLDTPDGLDENRTPREREFLRMSEILAGVLGRGVGDIKRADEIRVGKALRVLRYERKLVRAKDKVFKAWVPM